MVFTPKSNRKAGIFIPILGHSKTWALQTDYTQTPTYLGWSTHLTQPIPGCKIWNNGTFEDLIPWVNTHPWDTSPWMNTNCFGIEVPLGYMLAQLTGRYVYFYKKTRGNTVMSNDPTRLDRDPTNNELYPQAISGINQALSWAQNNNTPLLRDFIYINIWDVDAYDSNLASNYLAKRRAMIAWIRQTFLKPQLVDIFPRVNPDLINSTIFPYTMDIYNDQTTLWNDPKTQMIDTDIIPLNTDHIHRWTQAILTHSNQVYNTLASFY